MQGGEKKRHRDRRPLSGGAVRQRQVRHHPWWGTTNLAGAFGYCHLAESWTFMGPCFGAYPQGLAAIKPSAEASARPQDIWLSFTRRLYEKQESMAHPGGTPGALTEMRGEARTKKMRSGARLYCEVATSFVQGARIILQAPACVRCPLKMHITTVYICRRRRRSALSGAGNVCPGFNLCHERAGQS